MRRLLVVGGCALAAPVVALGVGLAAAVWVAKRADGPEYLRSYFAAAAKQYAKPSVFDDLFDQRDSGGGRG